MSEVETHTEWAVQLLKRGTDEVLLDWVGVDEDDARETLAENREDMPEAALRLVSRTVSTTPWEEVQ